MKRKNILLLILTFLIMFLLFRIAVFAWPRHDQGNVTETPKEEDIYRYDYRFDYMDERYTDEISIHVNKYNANTNQGKYYTVISGTILYRYINTNYGLTENNGETDFIQFSMIPEYIEGLSADNKYISGKLIDPKTKQQIGHWIYDLDKDDFKEVILKNRQTIKPTPSL